MSFIYLRTCQSKPSLLLCIAFLLCLSSCDCRQKVSGVVVDRETKKPLSGVKYVQQKDSGQMEAFAHTTNSAGWFAYSDISGGLDCPDIVLVFSKDYYHTKVKRFESSGDTFQVQLSTRERDRQDWSQKEASKDSVVSESWYPEEHFRKSLDTNIRMNQTDYFIKGAYYTIRDTSMVQQLNMGNNKKATVHYRLHESVFRIKKGHKLLFKDTLRKASFKNKLPEDFYKYALMNRFTFRKTTQKGMMFRAFFVVPESDWSYTLNVYVDSSGKSCIEQVNNN